MPEGFAGRGGFGGGMPGSGQGGGPGGIFGGGGGEIDPEMMATMQAMRAERTGGRMFMSPAFYEAIITLLEARAAEG